MFRDNPFEQGFPNGKVFLEEAVRLYEKVNNEKKGQMICLAGERGVGRTDFLKRLGSYLISQSPRPALVYGLSKQDEASLWPTVKKAFLPLAGLSTWVGGFIKSSDGGFLELVGQTYETMNSVGDAFASPSREDPEAQLEQVKTYIREVAQKRTVIWVFPNLDQQKTLWTTIVEEIAREFLNEYRVLIFISLVGPRQFDQIGLSDSDCLQKLRSFVKQGTAHWWYLSPLTKEEIDQSMGPMTQPLLDFILGLSGGKPQLLLDLWTLLYENDLIVQSEAKGSWIMNPQWESQTETKEFSALKDILRKRVNAVIGPQADLYFNDVWDLLKYAALEGQEFTAEAVLKMWQKDNNRPMSFPQPSNTQANKRLGSTELNRAKLIYVLDEILAKTDTQPAGLFLPKATVVINKTSSDQGNLQEYSVSLKKYSFAHPIFRDLVSRNSWFDLMERPRKIEQLIEVLTKLYEPELHYIRPTLANLYGEIGFQKRAAEYQRQHSLRSTWQELTLHARILRRTPTDRWEKWDYQRGVAILKSFLHRNANRIDVEELLNSSSTGIEWAEKISDKEAKICFSHGKGYAYWLKGDSDNAMNYYSLVVSQTQEEKNNLFKFLSLLSLSNLEWEKGNFNKARSYLEEAQKPANLIDNPKCLHDLLMHDAILQGQLGNLDGAEDRAKKGLKFAYTACSLQKISDAHQLLGKISSTKNRLNEAYSHGVQAIQFARKAGSLARESNGWNLLKIVYLNLGKDSLGLQALRKSYELIRGQMSRATFNRLRDLGYLLFQEGKKEEGVKLIVLCKLYKGKTNVETLREVVSQDLGSPSEEFLSKENFSQFFSEIEINFRKDGGNSLIDKILSLIPPPADSMFLNDAKGLPNVKPSGSNS
jgi:tetratricopeptide (TPR) repeat protein